MNVNRFIPATLRQFPRFIWQLAIRSVVLRKRLRVQSCFSMCYFTCGSHFKYLYCSLHSLRLIRQTVPLRVFVFCDLDDMLSQRQIEAIAQACPETIVLPWPRIKGGWGPEEIANIWKAFRLVANDSAGHDFIAKVDSDVFFCSDWIFRAASRQKADLVGDGHNDGFRFSQGGLYFIRAAAVQVVSRELDRKPMSNLLEEAKAHNPWFPGRVYSEDAASYHLVRQAGMKTWLTFFMMIPSANQKYSRLNRYRRWKYSCVHFFGCKEIMLPVYQRDFVPTEEREHFSNAFELT